MTGNFTLKSLIAALQLELNWYSKYFPQMEKDVKAIVKKAIEGELTENDFDSFYSSLTYRFGVVPDIRDARRPRRTLLHILRLDNYYHGEGRDEHELAGYNTVLADSEKIIERVIEEIMTLSGVNMLRRFYTEFNLPKDVPWSSGNTRFEMLNWMADDVSRKYPSGLQILIEEPRLTDAFSSEVYREFDEILGVLEKLNADPQYADAGERGYTIGYRNGGMSDYTPLSRELRKLLDGNIKPESSYEEREADYLGTRDNSPEGYLITQLTEHHMVPSVLQAIISATLTKHRHALPENRGGTLVAVKPGYFADLNNDIIKTIYNEGITSGVVEKVMDELNYYIFVPARVDIDDSNSGRYGFTGRKINSVQPAFFNGPKSDMPLRYTNGVERKPISAYLDQLVDFDFATKNDGVLKVAAIGGYYGYYRLLSNIVFKDFGPLLFDNNTSGDHKLQVRRQLTRIKGVPLRKVWELPLIVNPFRTPEEIFADLGYELHEVSEPNAKAEAPVRKPGSKRK